MNNSSILVLNKSYVPIGKTDMERSIVLIILGKARSIKDSDVEIRSPNFSIKVPEAIVLTDCNLFIKHTQGKPTKKRVLALYKNTCVFCGDSRKDRITLDHLYPRSRFKELKEQFNLDFDVDDLENTVAACRDCNVRKGDKTLDELGWPPITAKPHSDLTFDWSKLWDLMSA
jgi:5-methylcytosine-specific restriction endonuclease McrA